MAKLSKQKGGQVHLEPWHDIMMLYSSFQINFRRQIALPLSSIEALPGSNFKSTATLVMHEKENQ